MLKHFTEHIDTNLPFVKEGKLLIAVSGGLDSVVLTHLCHDLKLNMSLAHCNFNLRGQESDADEAFILELAEDLELEVFIESFETADFAMKNKISTQMAARELRYRWFLELAQQLHFDYILTAHHADDNLETFLINVSRGSGLEGFTGIPEINDNIVRPLLPFSREEIKSYAVANKYGWREDSSNASTKYLRNKLRHEVVPILKAINPQLLQNFNTSVDHLQDTKDIVEDAVLRIAKKVVSENDAIIKFDIKKLKKLSNTKAYVYQLLNPYNFTQWKDIVELLDAQSGKQVFSSTHRLLKDRTHLLLTEIVAENYQEIRILADTKKIKTAIGTLCFKEIDVPDDKMVNHLYVDKAKLNFPLIIRQWQEGDYFYPLGMPGRKKLSKYFKDEKLSLLEKEKALVLCSGDDIVWVINRRADRRFAITENTHKILKIALN